MYSKALLIISFLLFTIFPALAQNGYSYIGAEACGMCHKTDKQGGQLKIWQASKHAGAYETLKTEESDKIAKEKGFDTKAIETEDCLKCHAVGYNLDASLLGKKFKVEQGVQCESCHGPGSAYKKKKIMTDREKAIANGLLVYENVGEELCITCHNAESPTYVDFVFEEMWEKIKHPTPGSE
jgi:hypothetical protein